MASASDYHEYHKWVQTESAEHSGTRIDPDGRPVTTSFIPIDILREYWQPDRILLFLRADRSLDAHHIIKGYLRIFSTLVYISSADRSFISYLGQFSRRSRDDDQLPFRRKEDLDLFFSGPASHQIAGDAFYKYQFLFSPRQLASGTALRLHGAALFDHDILPMVLERDLNPNLEERLPSATELKLFKLAPSSGLQTSSNTLVAKIFPKSEVDHSFLNELAGYSALKSINFDWDRIETSKYFLNYYGSFIQNDTGVILLEYADQGSLLDFFKQADVPYTRDEAFGLWSSLSDLLRGLAVIHHVDGRETGNRFRGVHQDIKPSNIFVFSDGSGSSYRFRFKIGSFGLSSFALYQAVKEHGSSMSDGKSTKIYDAPELMRWHSSLDHLDGGVNSDVDMWSIGCVLFDIAVWCVCGERGLREFLADRKRETQHDPGAPEGCHGSFHNGNDRLQAVQGMADKLLARRRWFDTFTHPLCKLLCDQILIPRERGRLSALQAAWRLQHIVQEAARIVEYTNPRQESLLIPPPKSSQSPPAPPTTRLAPSRDDYPGHLDAMPTSIDRSPSQPSWEYPQHGKTIAKDEPSTWDPDLGEGALSSSEWRSGSQFNSSSGLPFYSSSSWDGATRQTSHVVRPKVLGDTDAAIIRSQSGLRTSRTLTQRSSTAKSTSSGNTMEITVKQLIQWRAAKNSGGSHELPIELRGVTKALQGRDLVFLIDNSSSMLRHWADVRETLEALVAVVKGVDPDGVGLRFTSAPAVEYKSRNTKNLLNKLPSNTPRMDDGGCMMAMALDVLIDSLVPAPRTTGGFRGLRQSLMGKPAKTGISVYILTNGIWTGSRDNPRSLCGVDDSIRMLIERLQSKQHGRAYFTLQFIRFGHDHIAKERLQYLGNNINEASTWDIVDQRYFKRPVKSMLIGALAADGLAADGYPDSEDGSEDEQPGPPGVHYDQGQHLSTIYERAAYARAGSDKLANPSYDYQDKNASGSKGQSRYEYPHDRGETRHASHGPAHPPKIANDPSTAHASPKPPTAPPQNPIADYPHANDNHPPILESGARHESVSTPTKQQLGAGSWQHPPILRHVPGEPSARGSSVGENVMPDHLERRQEEAIITDDVARPTNTSKQIRQATTEPEASGQAAELAIGDSIAAPKLIASDRRVDKTAPSSTEILSEKSDSWCGNVRCQWEVPAVISKFRGSPTMSQNQSQSSDIYDILEGFATLTGETGQFEYSTCGSFLRKTWDRVGECALRALSEATEEYFRSTDQSESRKLPDHDETVTYTLGHVTSDSIDLSLDDHRCQNLPFIDAMTWLCKAIRQTPGRIQEPAAVDTIWQSNGTLHVDEVSPNFLSYILKPLQPLPQEALGASNCWASLFRSALVACHPVVRDWGAGLELTYADMVRLTGVQSYFRWKGDAPDKEPENLLLLGFYTALIPTLWSPDRKSLQWHFEHRDDIIKPDDLIPAIKTLAKTEDFSSLMYAKCFIGWYPNANILLGTHRLADNEAIRTLRWSGLKTKREASRLQGHAITGQVSAGSGYMGPISLTAGYTQTYVMQSTVLRFDPREQYSTAIHQTARKVALLVDAETKQAWIVPCLSLILHMIHKYVQFYRDEGSDLRPNIPFADVSDDGATAALRALQGRGQEPILGVNGSNEMVVLQQAFHAIYSNLTASNRMRDGIAPSKLLAPELMDMIAEPSNGTPLKKIDSSDSTQGWWGLADAVDMLCVCSTLGPAIEPPSNETHQNCDCRVLAPGKFYLAAHLRCLEIMLQRFNNTILDIREGELRFSESAIWRIRRTPWVVCPPRPGQSVWSSCEDFIQEVSNPGAFLRGVPHFHGALAETGAVIFGHARRRLKKHAPR